jgi:two-component sensor histidine kinase
MLPSGVSDSLDLLLNLTLLIALTTLSDFLEKRLVKKKGASVFLQGLLFGSAAILGMLKPLDLGNGLIFDGRSVMVSLCSLYFGPWAALVASAMAIGFRLWIGGVGTLMGVLVVLSSAGIGLIARNTIKPEERPPSTTQLYVFGIVVHVAMLSLTLTLPVGNGLLVLKRIGLIVILLYPLATILAGKILSDQIKARIAMAALKRREEHLIRNLAEKEILLSEVHHRVKNNLNIISSLLNLQSSTIKTPEQAIAAFQNSRERIIAMSLVHEELYKSRDYTGVDMGAYLDKLAKQLVFAYGPRKDVNLEMDANGVYLSVNASIPCGLILNEIVTNSFKYAFPDDRSGIIRVTVRQTEDEHIEIEAADDGIGLPEGLLGLNEEERGSLGLTLVRLLVGQLNGAMTVSVDHGTIYRIRFPKRTAA